MTQKTPTASGSSRPTRELPGAFVRSWIQTTPQAVLRMARVEAGNREGGAEQRSARVWRQRKRQDPEVLVPRGPAFHLNRQSRRIGFWLLG
jgi:hypothetical protein